MLRWPMRTLPSFRTTLLLLGAAAAGCQLLLTGDVADTPDRAQLVDAAALGSDGAAQTEAGSGGDGATIPTDGATDGGSGDASSFDATLSQDANVQDALAKDTGVKADVGTPYKVIFLHKPPSRAFWNSIASADLACDGSRPDGVAVAKALLVGATRTACTTDLCSGGGVAEHFNWVLSPTTQYRRVDGTVIGTTDAAGLFTAPLTNAIAVASTVTLAWTGLGPTWLTDQNCTDWSNTSQGVSGRCGYANVDAGAFAQLLTTCDASLALYCVEQ